VISLLDRARELLEIDATARRLVAGLIEEFSMQDGLSAESRPVVEAVLLADLARLALALAAALPSLHRDHSTDCLHPALLIEGAPVPPCGCGAAVSNATLDVLRKMLEAP